HAAQGSNDEGIGGIPEGRPDLDLPPPLQPFDRIEAAPSDHRYRHPLVMGDGLSHGRRVKSTIEKENLLWGWLAGCPPNDREVSLRRTLQPARQMSPVAA